MKGLIFSTVLLFAACATPNSFAYVTDIESGKRYEIPFGAPQYEDLYQYREGDTVKMIAPDMRTITVKIEKL